MGCIGLTGLMGVSGSSIGSCRPDAGLWPRAYPVGPSAARCAGFFLRLNRRAKKLNMSLSMPAVGGLELLGEGLG
ncbi:hypothetical protein A6E20_26360 [Pseudomonas putida]|nr:hypothetical protein A6E20_26360 [Pseudomonas putida]OCT35597.1 hypothetical protein A6E24_23880 [Pseudomonas putida]